MPSMEGTGAKGLTRLSKMIDEWDQGTMWDKLEILEEFVDDYSSCSTTELEEILVGGGSLFLMRISVWLCMVFETLPDLKLTLKAVKIFLSSGSNRYISEFCGAKGIKVLIHVVESPSTSDDVREDALDLLCMIMNCDNGTSNYKEDLCRFNGIQVCCETLQHSDVPLILEKSAFLLEHASVFALDYMEQYHQGIGDVLTGTNRHAQLLVCQMFNRVQQNENLFEAKLVKAILSLLRTSHLGLQEEVYKLVRTSTGTRLCSEYLRELILLLVPPPIDPSVKGIFVTDLEPETIGQLSHINTQQASAAKLIRIMSETSNDICRQLIDLGAVNGLLIAMNNSHHSASQAEAADALVHLSLENEDIDRTLRTTLRPSVYEAFKTHGIGFYKYLTNEEAEHMCNLTVPNGHDNGH